MKIIKKCSACLCLLFFPVSLYAALQADLVRSLPGFGKVKQVQYAGYISAGNKQKMFYWFVAKDKHYKKAPIIIWTSGGPGASSLYGFFLENGPYRVSGSSQLKPNPNAWNHFANYLVFDQPMGIGLSFADKKHYPKTPVEGNEEFFRALKNFLLQHPALKHNPIYLSGESYAGTYIALLSTTIIKQNKLDPAHKINLKGVVLISGWVDPVLQESSDAEFAFSHGLIDSQQKTKVDRLYQQCVNAVKQQGVRSAMTNMLCSKVGSTVSQMAQLPNIHDIAAANVVSDVSMVAYLNNPKVRQSIHASLVGKYQTMTDIWDNYASNEQDSFDRAYTQLLKHNIRVLVFSGLNDGSDCNSLGARKWLEKLKFTGVQQFWSQPPQPWRRISNKQVLGYMQHSGDLTWVRVLNAGHMVPISQPKVGVLVERFIAKKII